MRGQHQGTQGPDLCHPQAADTPIPCQKRRLMQVFPLLWQQAASGAVWSLWPQRLLSPIDSHQEAPTLPPPSFLGALEGGRRVCGARVCHSMGGQPLSPATTHPPRSASPVPYPGEVAALRCYCSLRERCRQQRVPTLDQARVPPATWASVVCPRAPASSRLGSLSLPCPVPRSAGTRHTPLPDRPSQLSPRGSFSSSDSFLCPLHPRPSDRARSHPPQCPPRCRAGRGWGLPEWKAWVAGGSLERPRPRALAWLPPPRGRVGLPAPSGPAPSNLGLGKVGTHRCQLPLTLPGLPQ